MSVPHETSVKLPEATVYLREVGEGPPVLLINGLGAHTAMWESMEHTLRDFRLLQFDLPGAGQSAVPWRPLSVRGLARLATSVMDYFSVERADVLGYSMGGIVAQQLAHDAPERVERLVLAATTPGVGAVQGDPKALLNIVTPLRYISPGLYAKTIGSMAGGRARHDQAWVAHQGLLRLKHAPSWRGYLSQMQSMATWSGLRLLRNIEHDVLVVAGDDDPLTPLVNGMMLAYLLPNGRLFVAHDEGHLMVLDEESTAHPVIREFLTAEDLEQSDAWNDALRVTGEEVYLALSGVGPQVLNPLGWAGSFARRRWLRLGQPEEEAA